MDKGPWVAPQLRQFTPAPSKVPVDIVPEKIPESTGAAPEATAKQKPSTKKDTSNDDDDKASVHSRSDRRSKKEEVLELDIDETTEHFFIGDDDDESQRSRSERRFLPDKNIQRG